MVKDVAEMRCIQSWFRVESDGRMELKAVDCRRTRLEQLPLNMELSERAMINKESKREF